MKTAVACIWRTMVKRFSGRAAGANAKRSWYCEFCYHVHTKKVTSCDRCACNQIEYFQSQKELKRWQELSLLEEAGKISNLKRQIKFEFTLPPTTEAIRTPSGRIMTHTVDFQYTENGFRQYEDVKGIDTDLGHLKRELVRVLHGHEIKLY